MVERSYETIDFSSGKTKEKALSVGKDIVRSLYGEPETARKNVAKTLINLFSAAGFDVERIDNVDGEILVRGKYDRRVTNPRTGESISFLPNELLGKYCILRMCEAPKEYMGKRIFSKGYSPRDL